jgi:hypothetical protein
MDPEQRRRLDALIEAKGREADEIFTRAGAKIEARHLAHHARQERRRRILRLLRIHRAV